MELIDLLKLAGAILGSITSAGVIVLGFSSWLGKVWADRLMEKEKAKYEKELEALRNDFDKKMESYKVKLKKSEFIFQKEYEATSEFFTLLMRAIPDKRYLDQDWIEHLEDVVYASRILEKEIIDYLSKHSAVLEKKTQELLSKCLVILSDSKFEVAQMKNHEDEIKTETLISAEELLNNFKKIKENLYNKVHRQASI